MSKFRTRPQVAAQRNFNERRAELTELPLAARFERIVETNLWGAPSSRSGVGSELAATATLRSAIPRLLERLDVRSLLDVPCGDFAWLSTVDLPVDYIGADIVASLIESNTRHYAGAGSRRRFLTLDLTSDPLPASDVVLCRDCLVHLSFANVHRALENIRRSGATYLVATTFLDHDVNIDIDDGDWRMLNLERAPFNLPPALEVILEECPEEDGAYDDKALGVWRIA
jgi:hypothetical protein